MRSEIDLQRLLLSLRLQSFPRHPVMSRRPPHLAFLVLLLIAATTHALHFYLDADEKRCFLEEIPSDTVVEGMPACTRLYSILPLLNCYVFDRALQGPRMVRAGAKIY